MTTPIYVDIQALQRPETAERGIGRYVTGLVRAMIDRRLPIVGLGLNPALGPPAHLPEDLCDSPLLCSTTRADVGRRVEGRGYVHLVTSPLGVPDVATDAVFPSWMTGPSVRRVTVVYDLIPYLFPEHYATTEAARRFLDERRAEIVASDLLLAISECTRRDLSTHWSVPPETVVTIGAPHPHAFLSSDGGRRPEGPTRGRYVLAPVGYEWRKEPTPVIEGWSRVARAIRRRRQLVLVGEAPSEVRDGWIATGRELGVGRREMITTGRVDDAELRALYAGAELVVHGSRYEGFGLPVIEASMCGAPSITSDRGALPEILDCPESVFDPDDADSVAAAITRGLVDPEVRRRLGEAAARAATVSDDDEIGARVAAALDRVGAP